MEQYLGAFIYEFVYMSLTCPLTYFIAKSLRIVKMTSIVTYICLLHGIKVKKKIYLMCKWLHI